MGFVQKPHCDQDGRNHQDEAGEPAETRNGLQLHISFDDHKGDQHDQDRQKLGIQVSIPDALPLKQKQIDIERDGKNARDAHEINQEGVEVFPRSKIPLSLAENAGKECTQRHGNRIKQDQGRID